MHENTWVRVTFLIILMFSRLDKFDALYVRGGIYTGDFQFWMSIELHIWIVYIWRRLYYIILLFYIESQKGSVWPQRTSTSIVTLIVKSVYFGHNNRKTIKEDELKQTALLCRTIYTLYKKEKKHINPIQSPSWEYINPISLENDFLIEQVSPTYTV